MKTREQIYGQEAASILRDISLYRVLTENQLLQLYPGKQDKVRNLLSFLTRQGRILHDGEYYAVSPEALEEIDRWMLAAVWVLIDFIDKAEYHSTGDFPAKVIFLPMVKCMRSSMWRQVRRFCLQRRWKPMQTIPPATS